MVFNEYDPSGRTALLEERQRAKVRKRDGARTRARDRQTERE